MTAATLCLGTRKDANTWQKGCEKLGLHFDSKSNIKKPSPTMDELKDFFSSSPHWIFLGGHFVAMELYNEHHTVSVQFDENGVTVHCGTEAQTLDKDSGAFQLHKSCKMVLWGGCSVCSDWATKDIRKLLNLFKNAVHLGFSKMTGPDVVDAMLGAGFMKKHHFFSRVHSDDDPKRIREAWMTTALKGYGGVPFEGNFRAIDPNGKEWKIQDNEITHGRHISG